MLQNPEDRRESIKMANIGKEILHNLWTIWGISMTRVSPILYYKTYFYEKPKGRDQIDPPAVLDLKLNVN